MKERLRASAAASSCRSLIVTLVPPSACVPGSPRADWVTYTAHTFAIPHRTENRPMIGNDTAPHKRLLFGGIEAGGTKFVCAIGADPDHLFAETVIPTTTPAETLDRAIAFFRTHARTIPLAAVGIASFGPI